ncbi:MAG: competence/damage-inducible protein A [Geodermatophilaceae bacterium]|nr:competence/damage-inducible protein A [Geodermatophilaceae bacterium]
MSARAGIIVTGTEVLTGRIADRNGPWLAEELRTAGVDVAHVLIVGDRREDLRSALLFQVASGVDLVITSGGLGPTADDLTAEVVGEVQGRPSELDPDLERRIGRIVDALLARRGWRVDPAATAASTRKQALVPRGAAVLEPVGTAPGLVVPAGGGRSGPPVVVLPGPPAELQGMWPAALADPAVERALAGRAELHQRTLRLWNTPESELAATLRDLGPTLGGLEITTCLRGGELEVVTRYSPAAQPAYDDLVVAMQAAYPGALFSADGRTVDDIVAEALLARHLTIATAESCTAGLLAGRLTERAGSSEWVLGGQVVYSNAAKRELAGVPQELLEQVGAVSAEVAAALAKGARARLRADLGVGITGIAGPGGGSPGKPVGLVHLCVAGPARQLAREVVLPGTRADIRTRSVTLAMHMLRELLDGIPVQHDHGRARRDSNPQPPDP